MATLGYYEAAQILGVSVNATEIEIKKAYKKKALKVHPDHGGNQEDFSRLTEAKNKLLNSDRSVRMTQESARQSEMTVMAAEFGFDQRTMEKEDVTMQDIADFIFFGRRRTVTTPNPVVRKKPVAKKKKVEGPTIRGHKVDFIVDDPIPISDDDFNSIDDDNIDDFGDL